MGTKGTFAVLFGIALASGCGRSDFQAFDELAPLSGQGGTEAGGVSNGGTSRGGTSRGGVSGTGGTSFTGGGVSGTGGTFTGGVSGTGACGGLTFCGSACVDLGNDALNCGTCGNVCGPGMTCRGGFCSMTPCPPGFLLCSGLCVNPAADPANCGNCGNRCPSLPLGLTCEEGRCDCPGRQQQCGSACVDLQTDSLNCGSCGTRCAADQICADGSCRLDCPDEFTVCGDECRNLLTDPDNCGACGAVCPRLEVCNSGSCDTFCGPGITNCDGSCRDLRVDPQNCGACGNRCDPRQICSNGMCTTLPDQASYNVGPSPLMFVNACSQPGAFSVLPNQDDGITGLMLPFSFRFYGVATQSGWLSTNGILGFAGGTTEWFNQCTFAADGGVETAILAFWDDLVTRGSGICLATMGAAPNRQFVATWPEVQVLESQPDTTNLNFSIVLSETTNTIDVLYGSMFGGSPAAGVSASIGLARTMGYALDCCNQACVMSFTGRRYTPR